MSFFSDLLSFDSFLWGLVVIICGGRGRQSMRRSQKSWKSTKIPPKILRKPSRGHLEKCNLVSPSFSVIRTFLEHFFEDFGGFWRILEHFDPFLINFLINSCGRCPMPKGRMNHQMSEKMKITKTDSGVTQMNILVGWGA